MWIRKGITALLTQEKFKAQHGGHVLLIIMLKVSLKKDIEGSFLSAIWMAYTCRRMKIRIDLSYEDCQKVQNILMFNLRIKKLSLSLEIQHYNAWSYYLTFQF